MSASLVPVVLCLFSAVTVAFTNVLVKRVGDVLTARMAVALAMALSVLPLAPFVPVPPPATWPLIAVSMVVHWAYQFCLVRALHRGDLSLVFPVMRGLAPLATACFAAFALHERLSWLQTLGLFAASAAIIVFALPTAPTAYVLTRQLGGDSHLMAGIITLQTLLAAASLPLILTLLDG